MPVYKIDKSRAIVAAEFQIKYKDIFDINEFYDVLHQWLIEYGWSSVDARGNIESGGEEWETLYLERIDTAGMKEMWWWWRLQKVPSEYYKYHIDIDFHPLGILPAEVMRDGKKLKAVKGEVEVNLKAILEFDVGAQWQKHPILSMFNKAFTQRIFRKELYSDHKLELYREAYSLHAFIKRWFKLKSFLPYEEIEPFFPSAAYPKWKKE